MTEKEADIQMEKALNKIPFEMKKIKFALFVVKILREIKRGLRLWYQKN